MELRQKQYLVVGSKYNDMACLISLLKPCDGVLQAWLKKVQIVALFFLPCLSSIHEKANCIAIFWIGRPHSLVSCHFKGVWATCLAHKGGAVQLSALPKDTTSELAGLFSTTSPKCRAPSKEAMDTLF